MRILTLLVCLLGISATTAFAQKTAQGKPTQFDRLSSVIDCNPAQLEALFDAPQGKAVNIPVSNSFSVRGNVKMRVSKYGSMETLGIELSDYGQSIFALTRRSTPDGKTVFSGRILNSKYADGLLLQQKGDSYQLVKVETATMLPTCDQR